PQDLASAATRGQLGLTVAELGQTRHGAIVVEGRLSDVIKEADRVRPGWLMNIIAAFQVEHPRVAWMFAETRQLAEEWAYRWLAAARDRKSTRLNSSHDQISYAVFCLKKKKMMKPYPTYSRGLIQIPRFRVL